MLMHSRLLSSVGVVGAALVLAACASPYPQQGGYPQQGYPQGGYPQQQGQGNYAQFGRVTNVEYLRGGQTQGVAGAVVGGALIGRAIEQNMNRNSGQDYYRVTVQMENGSMRSFDYAQAPDVRIGERVRADGNQLFR